MLRAERPPSEILLWNSLSCKPSLKGKTLLDEIWNSSHAENEAILPILFASVSPTTSGPPSGLNLHRFPLLAFFFFSRAVHCRRAVVLRGAGKGQVGGLVSLQQMVARPSQAVVSCISKNRVAPKNLSNPYLLSIIPTCPNSPHPPLLAGTLRS